MRLGKLYGEERLEAACARAMTIGAASYRSIESILKQGLDRQPLPDRSQPRPALQHANVRGAEYYEQSKEVILNTKEECLC
jgi:hypothetical protein